eukprot:Skav235146  [mRNA]  locus=scaffold1072:133178:142762:- [translate_table: standard]
MEAALGGELYATYNRKGLHGHLGSDGKATQTSWGSAIWGHPRTVCALDHLHERRIIYRDLSIIPRHPLGQDDMPRQLEYEDDGTGWDADFVGGPSGVPPKPDPVEHGVMVGTSFI